MMVTGAAKNSVSSTRESRGKKAAWLPPPGGVLSSLPAAGAAVLPAHRAPAGAMAKRAATEAAKHASSTRRCRRDLSAKPDHSAPAGRDMSGRAAPRAPMARSPSPSRRKKRLRKGKLHGTQAKIQPITIRGQARKQGSSTQRQAGKGRGWRGRHPISYMQEREAK